VHFDIHANIHPDEDLQGSYFEIRKAAKVDQAIGRTRLLSATFMFLVMQNEACLR
jgi:hypothetical protein